MPQFILNHGSTESAHMFQELDSFTQAYIEAMFFTSTGSADDEELEHATLTDLAPETLERIKSDCELFLDTPAWRALGTAQLDGLPDDCPDDVTAGHDFWYTRNGHGSGFWDGDWPEPYATQLSDTARRFGSVDLYAGDNGLLYLA